MCVAKRYLPLYLTKIGPREPGYSDDGSLTDPEPISKRTLNTYHHSRQDGRSSRCFSKSISCRAPRSKGSGLGCGIGEPQRSFSADEAPRALGSAGKLYGRDICHSILLHSQGEYRDGTTECPGPVSIGWWQRPCHSLTTSPDRDWLVAKREAVETAMARFGCEGRQRGMAMHR